MIRFAFAAAALLLVVSGCISNNNHSVTIAAPSVPPSAAEYLKDGLLATKVRAQIAAVDIDAVTRLGIRAHDGEVNLTGVVRTADERAKIDAAVRKVSGVQALHDNIRVDPKAPSFSGGDLALAAHVTAALAGQIGVNAANVRVSAQNGVVTLSGHVPSASIKTTAVETAQRISGVKHLVDKLNVTR